MRNTIIKDPALEPLYLSKDKYCYTLFEVITPKKSRGDSKKSPQDYEKVIGHYTTLKKALQVAARERLSSPPQNYNSIREYLDRFEALKNEMEDLLNKLEI